LDGAVRAYESSIELEPGEPTAYLALRELYRKRGNVEAARAVLFKGLAACPAAAGLHFEMGLELVAENSADAALTHFQEAQRLEPDNLSSYREAATLAFKLGRDGEAVEVLKAALERDAANGPILLMLARYQIQSGQAEAAAASLTRGRKAGAPPRMLEELSALYERQFGRRVGTELR